MIALCGPLGVGKSEFCRAVIRARAGCDIDVPSPSFTLLQDYDLEGLTIRHVDLYRIREPDELVELGLEGAPAEDQAWLVEWAENAGGRLAGARLDIALQDGPTADVRIAHLKADATWKPRLTALADG